MNLEYAQKWATALGTDAQAFAALYADDCVVEFGTYADSVGEAILGPEAVQREMSRFSDSSNGKHTFVARNYEGHDRHGIIQWNWTGEGLSTFRGLPVDVERLETVGQSFLMFDGQGKVYRESTYWNDVKAVKALGVPVDVVHYWDLA